MSSIENSSSNGTSSMLTDEEAAIYDRQIRTWGLDAQKRMREASVLIVGLQGLGSEVCKNIVLAGIASLTVLDDEAVSQRDLSANFFINADDIGKNRAEASKARIQDLNPRVIVHADASNIMTKDTSFFRQFNVICLTNCHLDAQLHVNEFCRKLSKPVAFFSAQMFGYYAYFFEDFQEFTYLAPEKSVDPKPTEASSGEPRMVPHTVKFTSLKDVLSCSWAQASKCMPGRKFNLARDLYFSIHVLSQYHQKYGHFPSKVEELSEFAKLQAGGAAFSTSLLQEVAALAQAEINPVCAVFGGLLGQEILKAVSGKDAPHNNFLLYNAIAGRADVVYIHP